MENNNHLEKSALAYFANQTFCIFFVFSFVATFTLIIGFTTHNIFLICLAGLALLSHYLGKFLALVDGTNLLKKSWNMGSWSGQEKVYWGIQYQLFILIGTIALFSECICKVDEYIVNKIVENPADIHISFVDFLLFFLPVITGLIALINKRTIDNAGISGISTIFFSSVAFIRSFYILFTGVAGGAAFQIAQDVFRLPSGADYWIFSSYRTDAATTIAILDGNLIFYIFWVFVPILVLIVSLVNIIKSLINEEKLRYYPIVIKLVLLLGIVYMAFCVFTGTNWAEALVTSQLNIPIERQTFAIEQNLTKCLQSGGGVSCYRQAAITWRDKRNVMETKLLSVMTKTQQAEFHKEKEQADLQRNNHLVLLKKELNNRSDKELIMLQETIRYEKRRTKDIYYEGRWKHYLK